MVIVFAFIVWVFWAFVQRKYNCYVLIATGKYTIGGL